MPGALTRSAVQRRLIWLLTFGFALVIILLIGASLVAVRSSRSVRGSAASLASEQVLATQLISELEGLGLAQQGDEQIVGRVGGDGDRLRGGGPQGQRVAGEETAANEEGQATGEDPALGWTRIGHSRQLHAAAARKRREKSRKM